MKTSNGQIDVRELDSVAIMAQLANILPCASRPRSGARSNGGVGQDPREEAAKLWLDQAANDPWLVIERKIMAAMRVTFASQEHDGVAAHALGRVLALPKKEKKAGLIFFGSMQRDENCSFLPLSMVASEDGGKLARVLSAASAEELLALGEGICPSRPAAGAAQLAAAASANPACGQELRVQAREALAQICLGDQGAAQCALLSLDPLDSGEGEAGVDFHWPAASDYREAFAGAPLEREALLHLLERHREGDKLLAWCAEAGFEGARWPCSRAACSIGMEQQWPLAGLAEAGANRLREDEKALFWRLGQQEEALGEDEKNALAKEFGRQPSLAISAMGMASWITRQIYDTPERRELSWRALDERAKQLRGVWATRTLEDVATPMVLNLARVIGLQGLPPDAAWAYGAAREHLRTLQENPTRSSGRVAAEIESMLLSSEAAPSARSNKQKPL